MVCSCGAQLPDNARFCHSCGKPQRESDQLRETLPPAPAYAEQEGPAKPTAPPINFGNPVAIRVALLCASLSALLNAVPVVGWGCCLWMAGAGFLAVFV